MMKSSMSTSLFAIRCSLLGLLLFLLASSAKAAVGIEQYISITNQEFSATESAKPDDNSLGLVTWDQDAYSDEAVYFEAILRCNACSGGNNQATATLYSAGGAAVTNAGVSTGNGTYTLVRTATAITEYLTDDTGYTVRLTRDATAGTAYLVSARLIVVQSNSTKLTATQSQWEIGSVGATTNSSFTLPANPKIIYYDAGSYAPPPTITFEATLKTSDSNQPATAALSTSSTCASTVTDSGVSVSTTTWGLGRSNSLSLSSGTYYVCIKSNDGSATTSIANAKLILSQSHSGGITKVKTQLPLHTAPRSHNTDAYTTLGASLKFDPDHFTGARFAYTYESILQNSGGTGSSRLYNTADSLIISNSEVSTNETAFIRLVSQEITTNLPTTVKVLDTQLKNSGTETTTASGSWLTVTLTAYPNLSFSIAGVPANTTTNGVTTSSASEPTELDFGSLTVSTPKYLAHQLTATTNAASGYIVSVKMNTTLQGNYPANVIEEFPATWESPQAWTEPTGTTANVNTGWFGANTSDTRVTGWGSGSGLFGPVGTTSRTVMRSTGIDAGTSVYLTYVIEVNRFQPTDTYIGSLVYNILPVY